MLARTLAVIPMFFLAVLPVQAQDSGTNAGVSAEADFRMYCAECHGEEGKGDGPKSFGLSAPAPDLTKLSARNGGTFPRERLADVIDGRADIALHGGREMPVWGNWFKMEAAEDLGGAEGDENSIKRRVDNLIAYIEELQE
jgi:mono/diheme cytochrome c family protein